MRPADTRPPFAGLANLSETALAALPTPCYLLDEAQLRRNGEILLGVQQRTGCRILLAQKAFSNFNVYPVLAPYLAGTEASGLYESRLGREELPEKENHVFCAAYRTDEFEELLQYADHIVFNSPSQLAKFGPAAKAAGKSIGLVPTMGALHEGHGSLITAARKENELVIVSVFVNPTQFGPGEDLEAYPRTLEADCILAGKMGADIVFAPAAKEMYPSADMTWVEVTGDITKVLCGRSRPIHFRGVTTVVSKLFNLAQPDRAYFGQKDAQQVQVIKRMVKDLFFNVQLRIMPIVREADGLAKSSRNTYLSQEERTAGLILSKSLRYAEELFKQGERDSSRIAAETAKLIGSEPLSEIDYVEIYELPDLKPVAGDITGSCLLAVAVRFGTTRLIDNVILEVE